MDPRLSLALSIHSNPGTYALLIGSGVSRAAGIPTGWEVVGDLIIRVAAMTGEDQDAAPDPQGWYLERFSEEPDYSKILSKLGLRRDERQVLLRSYFEATEDEREEDLKQPTTAHKAIAELCLRKYIRVIVTTNFDKLLEQALSTVGVYPTIISTTDSIKGAPPLVRSDLVILKIHGDYLDSRILNTTGELESYPAPLKRYLDRILDEFGLIVCGWSSRWDPALRGALERCKNQRYTTYWTGLDEPDESLSNLLILRRAEFIRIDSGDELFADLKEKVLALEEHARPHPLELSTAVSTAKRYLSKPDYDIRLNDLIATEAGRVAHETEHFPLVSGLDTSTFVSRVEDFHALTQTLTAIVATTAFWSERRHERVLTRAIEDLSTYPMTGGVTALINLRYYPALLLIYSAGIASVANEKPGMLRAILTDPLVRRDNAVRTAAVALETSEIIQDDHAKLLPDMQDKKTPMSQWLEPRLREALRPVVPSDTRYEEAFDRFEYLWGLIHADLYESPWEGGIWGPIGNFAWRRAGDREHPAEAIGREIESKGAEWPLLIEGFFGSDLERLKEKKAEFDEFWRGRNLRR